MTDPDHFGALKPQLYTDAERQRRDSSPWTLVQGILAPVQFLIFLVSLALVLRTLMTGEGAFAAHLSILAKTLADRKSTRLNSSHIPLSRMPSSA